LSISLSTVEQDDKTGAPSTDSDANKNKGESAVKAYLQHYIELSTPNNPTVPENNAISNAKSIDFMALLSSVLLLNDTINIETKVDQLFEWIVLQDSGADYSMDEDHREMRFDEFYLAMTSFEKGLSHALGKHSLSTSPSSSATNYVKLVTGQWMSLADPHHKGSADATTRISRKNFFDFCTNRQHVVRRLLEAVSGLGKAARAAREQQHMQPSTKRLAELSEVDDTVQAHLLKEPKAGDEWMSNPAWKKTAERMLTPEVKKAYVDSKPISTLQLDWVHGYRGFDCRNNVYYADNAGEKIVFTAAALTILQDNSGIIIPENTETKSQSTAAAATTSIPNKIEPTTPAAADKRDCSQSYFGEHSDDIISLTTHHPAKGGMLLASGEIGKSPAIHMYEWVPNEGGGMFKSLAVMKGYHSKGVSQLSFSADGHQLFSVGVDYTVAVYCTQADSSQFGKMLASSQGPKDKVLHICNSFSSSSDSFEFLTCGEKHIIRWTGMVSGGALKQENVKISGSKSKMMLMCVCALRKGVYVVGSYEGKLLLVKDANTTPLKDNAEAAIVNSSNKESTKKGKSKDSSKDNAQMSYNCIASFASDKNMFVTGGRDGHVVIWRLEADKAQCSVLHWFTTSGAAVRAVSVSADGGRVLAGTQTCSILQWKIPEKFAQSSHTDSTNKEEVLVVGHFKDEVWGLAVRPSVGQYCTAGDDGYLRLWDAARRTQLAAWDVEYTTRAVAFSPDGGTLAVGYGGRVSGANKKWDGVIRIFRLTEELNLLQLAEIKEAKQFISVMKFSPDGLTLAVGSRDNSVYLYSVPQQYRRKAKFSKHNAGITFLDFTTCSKYIQSCCSAYEILFSSTDSGTQLTDGASKLVHHEWHTWTCTLGWAVLGIWSGTMDGSDINAVDRSPCGRLLATADDFGCVSLFRFPCISNSSQGAQRTKYTGHSSHVTSVRWMAAANSTYLLSIGGEDKCVFQWKLASSEPALRPSKGGENDEKMEAASKTGQEDGDDFEAPGGGDEFTAVKPWLGAIVAPTAWANPVAGGKVHPFFAALSELSNQHGSLAGRTAAWEDDTFKNLQSLQDNVLQKMYESGVTDATAPSSDDLELEWVHGYRGFDCRNNVFYVGSGDQRRVVYYCAALGVVLDPAKRLQKYFKGHTDDIVSMAIFTPASSSVTTIAATGQQGPGSVLVWEVGTLKTLATVSTGQKSVSMLCFSQTDGGRLLVSVGDDKTVAVCDWKSQTVLCNTKGEPAATHHMSVRSGGVGLCFVSCGDKHIRFWSLSGRNLTASKVSTSPLLKAPIQFLCCVAVGTLHLVGADDGFIYMVDADGKALKYKFAHSPAATTTAAAVKVDKKGDKVKETTSGSPQPSVTALTCQELLPHEQLLLSGGKDGSVSLFNVSNLSEWDGGKEGPKRLMSFMVGELFDSVVLAKQVQSVYACIASSASSGASAELLVCVGTRGCDLLEVKVNVKNQSAVPGDASEGVLMRAHCNDELWGLATHPSRPEYCTVGDDKTLRFFGIHERCMIAPAEPLGLLARSVAYCSSGTCVAVGFGGRVGRGKEAGGGVLRVYATPRKGSKEGAKKLCERQDSKQCISDVKFSGDDKTLVAGSHDCKIYIYNVAISSKEGVAEKCELKLRGTFSKHNSVISHLDISSDGRFLQSNCAAYELLFCELASCKQITSATELRDVKWLSWTCSLGWPVQGIWAPGMDGSDINSVARSHSGHLLATSDDLGKVNLYRYPCTGVEPAKSTSKKGASSATSPGSKNAACNAYKGHSSHVMNVRWTALDECLISCGGNDKCIMQWRHSMAGDFDGSDTATSSSSMTSAGDKHKSVKFAGDPETASTDTDVEEGAGEDLFGESPGGGDESGAVKPWLGAIKAPSNPPPISPQPPAALLSLQWVHGYTSGSVGNIKISNNAVYNASGNPCYSAAALAVQLVLPETPTTSADPFNLSRLKQSYFEGHSDDVVCVAIDRSRRFLATGQLASTASKGKGSIILWDAATCRLLSRLEGCHQRAVALLAFSWQGDLLLSVGQDDQHTHNIWSDAGGGWSRVSLLASQKGDKAAPFFVRWVNPSNALYAGEYQLLSGGPAGVNFWKIEGSALSKKPGRFGRQHKQQPLLCAANLLGVDKKWRMVLGTSGGDLYVFEEREVVTAAERAHSGAVLSLAEGGGGEESGGCVFLVSGGKDRCVKVWNQSLQPVSLFDVTACSCVDGSVASVDIRPAASTASVGKSSSLTLLVGTYGGELIQIRGTASSAGAKGSELTAGSHVINLDLSDATAEVLLHSHFGGELWGLAMHPIDRDLFASAGDDSTLRVWSIPKNCQLGWVNVGHAARALAWHPSGSIIAVGLFETVKGGGKKDAKAPKPKDLGGAVHLYFVSVNVPPGSEDQFVRICGGCASVAWIAELKFHKLAKGDSVLAVGSHDKKLYVYTIPSYDGGAAPSGEEWTNCLKKPRYVFDKHSSAVLHVDFSRDGLFFQTNCQASELLFANAETGKQETSASKLADYNNSCLGEREEDDEEAGKVWDTQTCKLGWPVQGIWPPGSDSSDINAVDRHPNMKLLATADDSGKVKLFRFPCISKDSKGHVYEGHSSHVTNVRWSTSPSRHLVSAGGNDKCLFVWNLSEK